MYPERKTRLFYWFRKKGVKLIGGVKLDEIKPAGLSIIVKDNDNSCWRLIKSFRQFRWHRIWS